jgi:Domain of unknown function (DUF4136)
MKVCLIATMLLALPGIALAQKTSFDYDKSANFSSYKTYAMREGAKVGNPLIDNRIVAAIEHELAAKGFTKTETNPSLLVVYHVAFDKQQDISGYTSGTGAYGWRYGGGMGTTDLRVSEILIGTLVIDLTDAAKKEVVWRGMGVKEIDTQAKAEKLDKNINGAVAKMLKNYPPKVKS